MSRSYLEDVFKGADWDQVSGSPAEALQFHLEEGGLSEEVRYYHERNEVTAQPVGVQVGSPADMRQMVEVSDDEAAEEFRRFEEAVFGDPANNEWEEVPPLRLYFIGGNYKTRYRDVCNDGST